MSDLRVEAVGFPDHYCAVYRRDGCPDIMLDGPDGRPRRFPSAYSAIAAARAELLADRSSASPTDQELFGADRWHIERAATVAADQLAVLGGVVVDGRVIPVERRRR